MSAPVRVEPVAAAPVAAAPLERTSSGSSGPGGTSLLAKEAAEGVQILERLSNVCRAQFQCPPMSPSYVSESKAVILLRGTKAGAQQRQSKAAARTARPLATRLASSCALRAWLPSPCLFHC